MMTRLRRRLGTCGLARLLRGWRLDRNPLRRGSDRAETIVLGALLAVFLAAVPFAAHAAGSWGYASAARTAQAQRTSLHPVTATLSQAQPVFSNYGPASDYVVQARWWAPDGRVRTGELSVTADVAAGHTMRIWIDRSGRLTGPPLSRDQLTGRAELAAGAAIGCLATVLITAAWLTRRALDRRRLTGWDADWLANGPRWTPRR